MPFACRFGIDLTKCSWGPGRSSPAKGSYFCPGLNASIQLFPARVNGSSTVQEKLPENITACEQLQKTLCYGQQ